VIAVQALLALAPVTLFLVVLWVLDSFQLIRPALLARGVAAGVAVALLSLAVATALLTSGAVSPLVLTRYLAPVYEEIAKALVVVWAIRTRRVGFMVDAAILGFAVGAGFAAAENLYYLARVADPNPVLWAVRGFGTAILHGSTTAVFGIAAKAATEARERDSWTALLPAVGLAIAVHSAFNHLVLPPLLFTGLLLVAFPLLVVIVFQRSERILRSWLDVGLGSDVELLEMLRSGEIAETRIGRYLRSLRGRFPPEVLVDMLCYLQLHVELSIKAKGLLLLQEAGLEPRPDPEIGGRLSELAQLQKNIGPTGRLALAPLVSASSRDLWQLRLLEAHAGAAKSN